MEMLNLDLIYKIIMTIVAVGFGGLCYYFKTKQGLAQLAESAINKAEELYKDVTKAGGQKFQYAVDMVYDHIPVQIRWMISKDMIAEIIQNVFDRMEAYAKMQLDKAVDTISEKK